MSKASLQVVLERISYAPKKSQIAVFKTQDPAVFNAVFDSTVMTQAHISCKDPDYIGSYHSKMDKEQVIHDLRTSHLL